MICDRICAPTKRWGANLIFPCIFVGWPGHHEYVAPVYFGPELVALERINGHYIGGGALADPCGP